jgi:amino acid adenylation domain-containing protein
MRDALFLLASTKALRWALATELQSWAAEDGLATALAIGRDSGHRPAYAATLPAPACPAKRLAALALFTLRACNATRTLLAVEDRDGRRALVVTAAGDKTIIELTAEAEAALAAPAAEATSMAAAVVLLAEARALETIEADLVCAYDAATESLHVRLSPNFAPAGATSALDQLAHALAIAEAQDTRPLAQVWLASRANEARWSAQTTGPSRHIAEESITRSIARQAEATPDRLALLGAARSWTYRQMWAVVESRAGWLRQRGAGPGKRVAICLRQSPDLYLSVAAVLRAGAAYVPLDPLHPSARIDRIREDAGAALVLCDADARARHAFTGGTLIALEEEQPAAPPPEHPGTDDLAYIIYTSGSTGAPKGVAVAHRSMQAEFAGLDLAQGSATPTVWLGVTRPTFDPSVSDLLWTLSRGHTVAVHEGTDLFSDTAGLSVAADILRHGAKRLQLTPSAAAMLLADPQGPNALSQLDALQVGGEAISRHLASAILAHMRPDAGLYNFYGPTETTVWISAGAIDPDQPRADLGQPFANTRLHVLAPDGGEQAPYTPGEIFIGGATLSLGYWNSPAQTERAFVTDPHGRGRLYRTGDLAMRLEDGRLVYLGRSDHQVKVRGHRIELAEVERAVAQAGPFEQIAVLAQPLEIDGQTDNRLIAFLKLRAGASYDEPKLRAALSTLLPAAVTPSAFVTLETFPLTPNGKIDRRALLERAPIAAVTTEFDSDLEKTLHAIWAQALGVQTLGRDDDFFALGGNSLAGARILAAVSQQLGPTLGLAVFLRAPTVASMAASLAESPLNPPSSGPLVQLTAGAQGASAFYCVHGAGGNVLILQKLAASLGSQHSFYGFQARGVDSSQTPLEDIREMASFYVEALRAHDPHGPYRLGGFSGGGVIAQEMAHLLRAQGSRVQLVVLFDTLAPWLLERRLGLLERLKLTPEVSPRILLNWLRRLAPTKQTIAETTLVEQRGEAVIDAMNRALAAWRPPGAPRSAARHVSEHDVRASTLDTPTLLFRATHARLSYVAAGAALGWDAVLKGPLEIAPIDADHFDMLEGPPVAKVAALLRQRLASLDASAP